MAIVFPKTLRTSAGDLSWVASLATHRDVILQGGDIVWDFSNVRDLFEQGESDWNDQQIVDLCRHSGCALLTNDADFKDASIDILTCNSKLLGFVKY